MDYSSEFWRAGCPQAAESTYGRKHTCLGGLLVRRARRAVAPDLTAKRAMPFLRSLGVRGSTTILVCCFLACLFETPAQAQRNVPHGERAQGAEQVVVGHVSSVTAVWRTNDFGDRLITSVVHVIVEETLKGAAQPSVDVEVEGGTIGDLTLRVSDLDTFAPGERALFYLRHSRRGTLVPHLRGLGLLKIDQTGRIRGTSTTLDQIRNEVRAAAGR